MTESKIIRNVVVYLGSGKNPSPECRQAAVDFADYLAAHDITLVFGGSNKGMMKILADAMLQRNGRMAGIFTRCLSAKLFRDDLTESVITDTLAERKAGMLRRADAVVALPGNIGTLDDLFEALAQSKLRVINCPIGVLNINGFYDPLFSLLGNSKEVGLTSSKTLSLLCGGSTPEDLFENFHKAK